MNWVSLAVVGFVLFSSWGCSPLSGLNPAQNNNASSEVGIHNATQVFAGQCIFSPPVAGEPTGVPLALLLPLVEPLIGAAYDLTVAAVRKGGEDTDVTYGGHVNLIGTRDDMPRCIQLVRGSFYTNLNAHDRAGGVKLGRLVGATEDAENAEKVVRERLAKADVLLADEPDLFLSSCVSTATHHTTRLRSL